jgi:hypothetical protein
MPRVEFEPRTEMSELVKTGHALDRAATMIGTHCINKDILCLWNNAVDNISEDVLKSFYVYIKIDVGAVPYAWAFYEDTVLRGVSSHT